jgi:polar amino acid transport system substrate-binding protein
VADLKGKNVAVVANSAGDIAASKVFGKASKHIKRFDNTPLALEELSAGGVDAAIGDVGVFAYYALQNPEKQFNMARDPSFEDQYFGIAVRKGNTKVLNEINEGLKKVIASGAYAKVYAKWFGEKAPVPVLPIK